MELYEIIETATNQTVAQIAGGSAYDAVMSYQERNNLPYGDTHYAREV
jgi:hypothetical protein